MKPFEKNYLECRFYIIGDREVGKKSFIDRLLNIPSTSLLRNLKAEEQFKTEINKLLKENELSDEEYYSNLSKLTMNSGVKDSTHSISKINFKNIEQKEPNANSRNNKFKSRFNNNSPSKDLEEKRNRLVMKSLVKYQVLSSRYSRPPIPEYPSKLFNVNKSKIVVKPFYLFPGEEISDFYPSEENSNLEYTIEGNPKKSMKGIITDLYHLINNKNTIINLDKLTGYKIYIYNFFIFLYDLSDFESFETMRKYFEKINTKINTTNIEENSISCIIGNKKEKKIKYDKEQEIKFNEFIKSYNNLYLMEISTKPFFNFDKFFYELFFTILTKYHEKLFAEEDFRANFESISLNKATFSKGLRETYDPYKDNPGPIYNLNSLYRYISPRELIKAFHDQKKRFNQKIFENKLGPVFGEAKSGKDFLSKSKLKYFGITMPTGGVLNKTPKGFSFGTVDGKLNLVKSRKDMISEINKNIRESLEGSSTLYNKSPSPRSKDKDYFETAKERKNQFLIEKSNKNKEINEKKFEKNKLKLKLIEEKEEQKKNLLRTKLKLFKSSSTPNMFAFSNKGKTDQDFYREHLANVLYPKNKIYLSKYNKKRDYIIQNMPAPQTPGPNAYNISTNILDPKRGAIILERRKPIEVPKADPQYPDFKDEFDLIVLNAQKTAGIEKFYRPRFREIEREPDPGAYNDSKIWKKWEKNKKILKKSGRLKKFLDERKEKLIAQQKNEQKIIEDKKEIEEISRAISIQKGYGDPSELKTINYNLVEESSPKYSIKGKNIPKTTSYDDLGNMFLNESEEVINAIVNEQMTRPLPDFNYVRPRLPGIVFSRAERFKSSPKYEGSELLFPEGVFLRKTQTDFFNKQQMSNNAQRTVFGNTKKDWPSPAQYKIKGSFEIIAEKGKEISDRRDEIRNKEKNKNNFTNNTNITKGMNKNNMKENEDNDIGDNPEIGELSNDLVSKNN